MVKFTEQAHVKDVPKVVLLHAIEAISEGLINDARYNYGREFGYTSHLVIKESEGTVFCEIKFPPYEYKFRWLVVAEKTGHKVMLVGATPDAWHEFITKRGEKLKNVVDTQWAAFVNFSIGYLTADYYRAGGKAKTHIKRAHAGVKKLKS